MHARFIAPVLAALLFAACGPGSPGGPTINNRMNPEPAPSGPAIQSNDILAREARANEVSVQHILISWKGRTDSDQPDPRAEARTREEADGLAASLLDRVRAGESMTELMAEYSEDPGSATSGIAYDVTPATGMVYEFKRLALRLDKGEAGLVLSDYGWHIMLRVE